MSIVPRSRLRHTGEPSEKTLSLSFKLHVRPRTVDLFNCRQLSSTTLRTWSERNISDESGICDSFIDSVTMCRKESRNVGIGWESLPILVDVLSVSGVRLSSKSTMAPKPPTHSWSFSFPYSSSQLTILNLSIPFRLFSILCRLSSP